MSRSGSKLQHFLLVFNHERGALDNLIEFGADGEKAVEAYSAMEDELRTLGDPAQRIEIVLIGSDSIETVRRTHANYFDGPRAVSRWLDLTPA